MAEQPGDRWVSIILTIWPDKPLDIHLNGAPPWLALAALGEAAERLTEQLEAEEEARLDAAEGEGDTEP